MEISTHMRVATSMTESVSCSILICSIWRSNVLWGLEQEAEQPDYLKVYVQKCGEGFESPFTSRFSMKPTLCKPASCFQGFNGQVLSRPKSQATNSTELYATRPISPCFVTGKGEKLGSSLSFSGVQGSYGNLLQSSAT